MKVTIGELTKPDFDNWYFATYPQLALHPAGLSAIPFDFQIGPLESYLRSVGIYARVQPDKLPPNGFEFIGKVYHAPSMVSTFVGYYTRDYNQALAAALNEGFTIREQQLKELVNA